MKSHYSIIRILIPIISLLLYGLALVNMYQISITVTQTLAVIPVFMIGWFFGPWFGLLGSITIVSATIGYLSFIQFDNWQTLTLATTHGYLIIFAFGIIGGWLGQQFFMFQEEKKDLDQNARYKRMVEQAGDMVFLNSPSGKFEYANPQAQEFSGYSLSELSTLELANIVHPSWLEKVNNFYNTQITQGVPETYYEFPIITREGDIRWIEQVTNLLRDENEITGLQSIARDVTDKKEAQKALSAARDEALAAHSFKSRTLATLSHDIRTPLNAIMGYTSLLKDEALGDLNQKQQETTTKILSSAQQMRDLITNILNQAELEGGKIALKTEDVNPENLLGNAENLLSGFAESKNILLSTNLDPELPTTFKGDFQRLQQIILNLGNNAIKFTDKGHVAINIRQLTPKLWAIEVSDTGPGIAMEDHHKIFEPFSKGDGKTGLQGTGLGLSIVQEYTELMDGEIQLESEQGVGSTFRIIIPLKS